MDVPTPNENSTKHSAISNHAHLGAKLIAAAVSAIDPIYKKYTNREVPQLSQPRTAALPMTPIIKKNGGGEKTEMPD